MPAVLPIRLEPRLIGARFAEVGAHLRAAAVLQLDHFHPAVHKAAFTPSDEPAIREEHLKRARYAPLTGQLFGPGASGEDVIEGSAESCGVCAAAVSVGLASFDFLRTMFTERENGTIDVRFFRRRDDGTFCPEWVNVTRSVPVDAFGRPLYAKSTSPNRIWPMILEKAYAKWKGGYDLVGGDLNPAPALSELIGFDFEALETSPLSADQVFERVRLELGRQQPVVTFTPPVYEDEASNAALDRTGIPNDGRKETGVLTEHSYSVIGARTAGDQKLIELRNPWGDHVPVWANPRRNGRFEIPAEDFVALFPSVIFPDPEKAGLDPVPAPV